MPRYMTQSVTPCVLLPLSSRSSKQFAIYDYFWHKVLRYICTSEHSLLSLTHKYGCNWRQRKRGIHRSSKRADM